MRTQIAAMLLVATMLLAAPGEPATAAVAPPDCNGDGVVSISEVLVVFKIASGDTPLSACPPADANGDGLVTINEVVDIVVGSISGIGGPLSRRLDETCSDGTITVSSSSASIPATAAAAGIAIGSATGAPGSPVQIDATLNTMGQPVVGVQNDLVFDPALADVSGANPCASRVSGKSISTAVVACPGPAADPCPPGSEGKKRLRTIIVGLNTPTALILDGPLYRCTFTVAAGAPPGSAPLACTNAIAALYGNPPTPTLTGLATPTPTITVAPSATATVGDPTATSTTAPPATSTPTTAPPATSTPAPPAACVGDCNLDQWVRIDELIRGVSIALSLLPLDICPAFDCHGTGHITIDCVIKAVNNAINGCPSG